MTIRIFRRIFIVYAVIVLLAGVITEIYITSAVRENYIICSINLLYASRKKCANGLIG